MFWKWNRVNGACRSSFFYFFILIIILLPSTNLSVHPQIKAISETELNSPETIISSMEPTYIHQTTRAGNGSRTGEYNYTDVLVIYNENSALSIQIALYFQNARNIPNINMCNISTSTTETVSRTEFDNIRGQIESYLDNNNLTYKINYLVTTKGVPLRVSGGTNDRACLDSELTMIKGQYQSNIGNSLWYINPYFELDEPFSKAKHDLYLVTRFTGFTWPEIKGLIDNATVSSGQRGTYVLDVDASKGFGSGGYGIDSGC